MASNDVLPAFSILGAPGCGKGTQAKLIQDRLGFMHVSSGDIFRQAIEKGDPFALKAQDLMQRGELVPDQLIRDMVAHELASMLEKADNPQGVILDGFPRTAGQAELLDNLLSELNLRFAGMINLVVPENLLIERLLKRGAGDEQRPDDNEDVIRERMRVWREKTQPLEDYYKNKNQLISIDGVGEIEEIFNRLKPVITQG